MNSGKRLMSTSYNVFCPPSTGHPILKNFVFKNIR